MIESRHPVARVTLVMAIVISLFSLTSARAHGATTPRIVLKPNTGPPGVPFTVSGQGFMPSEYVDLSFDRAFLALVHTLPDGTFTKTVGVGPQIATPGRHRVSAYGQQGGEFVQATYVVRTNWPRYHFDNANTGYNPYEGVLSASNVGTLHETWSVALGGTAAPDPIVAYGKVYVAPTDGIVRALDQARGTVIWSFDSGGTMSGTAPTAANNLIYVGNENGDLYALSASTGSMAWVRHLGLSISDSPIVSVGALYINAFAGSATTFMYSLDPLSGATNYFTDQALWDGTPPTLAYDLVLDEAGLGCAVQALDAATGAEQWFVSFCSGGDNSDAVAAANGLVFEGDDTGTHALDPDSGAVQWTSVPAWFACAVANGVVFAAANHLQALDANTGAVLWDSSVLDGARSAPIVANGVVYLGQGTGTLRAYGTADGALLWTSPVQRTSPATRPSPTACSTRPPPTGPCTRSACRRERGEGGGHSSSCHEDRARLERDPCRRIGGPGRTGQLIDARRIDQPEAGDRAAHHPVLGQRVGVRGIRNRGHHLRRHAHGQGHHVSHRDVHQEDQSPQDGHSGHAHGDRDRRDER
jgi:outer membrane protein assembly factor BamB